MVSAKSFGPALIVIAIALTGCGGDSDSSDGTSKGYYPPVESKAGDVSPERQAFIDEVDTTCASTFNDNQARMAQVSAASALKKNGEKLVAAESAAGTQRQYKALKALGPPPDGADIYNQWLDNVHQRAELKLKYAAQVAQGQTAEALATTNEILTLKIKANELGQKFGLRICTSNGPGREPVR